VGVCGETDRKLDYRDRLRRRKKEKEGRQKNANVSHCFV